MDLSPDDIRDLLLEQYPRHIRDAQVSLLSSTHVPGDPIVLIVDESLWEFDNDLGRSAHSMTLALARQLYNQLGEAIDQVEQLD